MIEDYLKRELNFGSTQNAYNITVGALLWRKMLMAAADFGQFSATPYERPPATAQTDIKKIRDETQARLALHYFFRANIGLISLVFTDNYKPATDDGRASEWAQRLALVAQYRF